MFKDEREAKEKDRKEAEVGLAELFKAIQQRLDKHVSEVRLSSRLTSSPACLVADGGVSPRLDRILGGKSKGVQRRILELNPGHAVVKQMKERFDKNQQDPRIGDFSELLLGQAILAEGGDLPDPTHFGQLLIALMIQQG